MFTAAELAELEAFDAQIDESFEITAEEIVQSDKLDRRVALDNMDVKKRRKREAAREYARRHKAEQKAYYLENKERIKAYSRAYYAAHREEILAKKSMQRRVKI